MKEASHYDDEDEPVDDGWGGVVKKLLPASPFRFLWFVLFGFTTFNLFQVLFEYFDYDIVTKVYVEADKEALFPGLTICNLNRVHCGNLWHQIEKFGDQRKISDVLCTIAVNIDCNERVVGAVPKFCQKQQLVLTNQTLEGAHVTFTNRRLSDQLLKLPIAIRKSIGHYPENTIEQCIFGRNENCTTSDYYNLYYNIVYGNCFTVNDHWIFRKPNLVATSPGPLLGLKIVLHTDPDHYPLLPGITDGKGFRVSVGEPTAVMLMSDDGFYLDAGRLTSVAVERKERRRMEEPYTSMCRKSWLGAFEDLARHLGVGVVVGRDGLKYSQLYCQRICQLRLSAVLCGCHYAHWNEYELLKMDKNIGYCEMTNATQMACVDDVLARRLHQTNCPDCREGCSDVKFDLTVSSSQWTEPKTHSGSAPSDNAEELSLHRDRAKMSMYYRSLDTEAIVEEEMVDWLKLVTKIGGALSVALGLSFWAIVKAIEEFVYFVNTEVVARVKGEYGQEKVKPPKRVRVGSPPEAGQDQTRRRNKVADSAAEWVQYM